MAAEQWVGGKVGVECGLELIGKVAAGDSAKDLSVSVGDPRVASASPAAPFLEDLLTDRHPPPFCPRL